LGDPSILIKICGKKTMGEGTGRGATRIAKKRRNKELKEPSDRQEEKARQRKRKSAMSSAGKRFRKDANQLLGAKCEPRTKQSARVMISKRERKRAMAEAKTDGYGEGASLGRRRKMGELGKECS